MKKFFLLMLLFCSPIQAADTKLDLVMVPLDQVVSIYYGEIFTQPFVICSDLLQDNRPVSIRASGKILDATAFAALLDRHGYRASIQSGVTIVCKKPEGERPTFQGEPFLYKPKYRSVNYLINLASPFVGGVFSSVNQPALSSIKGSENQSNSPAVSSQVSYSSHAEDMLVFQGSVSEVSRLKSILSKTDIRQPEVVIRAHIYEVGKSNSKSSALSLLSSLVSGRLSLDIQGSTLGNSLKLKLNDLSAVFSALDSDSRFTMLTSPFARVRSGASARFVVGQDVPVLGSVITTQSGSSQQSVDYRSSGVIFEVTPKVSTELVELEVFQQISSFIKTETGLSSTPTLNKREVKTILSARPGEVIVLGGLNDNNDEKAKSGLAFFPFSFSKSSSSRGSELLLFIEVTFPDQIEDGAV